MALSLNIHALLTQLFLIAGFRWFTINNPLVYFVMFFIWGHTLVAMSFLLSVLFQRERTATSTLPLLDRCHVLVSPLAFVISVRVYLHPGRVLGGRVHYREFDHELLDCRFLPPPFISTALRLTCDLLQRSTERHIRRAFLRTHQSHLVPL